MVSRARINRRILPRDEHVSRGIEASERGDHDPFMYKLKYKSGTSRTQVKEVVAHNRIDLFAKMITEHAEEGRDFFVWNISRSLQYQAKARDY